MNKYFLLICFVFFFFSCGEGNSESPCSIDYEGVLIYENLADNVIIPAYQDLQIAMTDLNETTEKFFDDPTVEHLEAMRTATSNAYILWQYAEPYQFGPAESVYLKDVMNNFPININLVEMNIANDVLASSGPGHYDQGFPALDALFWGDSNEEQIIETLTFNGSGAVTYESYIKDIIDRMFEAVNTVSAEWQSTYRTTFINNDGTAAGSSLSLIVNAINQHFEFTKRDRLGIPSGALTLDIPNPDKVEGRNSGLSTELLAASMEASKRFYKGMNDAGIDDYLAASGALKNEILLSTSITENYDQMLSEINALNDPLQEVIEFQPEKILSIYALTANQVVQMKTDMPSVLCVSITYIDNPSDSD